MKAFCLVLPQLPALVLTDPVTGQVKLKVSPTKRPQLTKRRADSADWDNPCPTRVGSSLSGTSGKPPLPPPSKRANSTDSPATAKKPKKYLTTHNDADRVFRVNSLIAKNEATPGFFWKWFLMRSKPKRLMSVGSCG